jgi:rhamnogalacturonyl hydrolase YesR
MKHFLTALLLLVCNGLFAQKANFQIPVQKVIDLAEKQYQYYIEKYPDSNRFARSTKADGSLGTTGASEWTSGFFAGSLWYLYQFTNRNQWKNAAVKWTAGIESQKNNKRTHDLGFMMFNSFGNGYRITKNPAYKTILIEGAKSLSTRFHPEVGAIRSWDNKKFNYPVIVDNLMNLEFLFWATKTSGDSSFSKIAVTHANTDLIHRFRKDNSTYHVLDFDSASGKLLRRMTHQGFSDSSCWSRGQAWAIYGFTALYRETRDSKFLNQAIKTANYFLEQTDKINDHIPYWDFDAPDIPKAARDASAAAIASSALFELSKYAGVHYRLKAEELLNSLCSNNYLATAGTNNFFLLKHSTGNKPAGTEIDVPIVYADYYLLEALWRYKNYSSLFLGK